MSFNKHQLRDLISRTLIQLGYHSESAVALLLGTAAQESKFGTYIRQFGGGPALGIFQMEPATEKDIWNNFIAYRAGLKSSVFSITRIYNPNPAALEANLAYQIIMARLQYRRAPGALPAADDIFGMAAYWKRSYNTPAGKGTVRKFVRNFTKYVL